MVHQYLVLLVVVIGALTQCADGIWSELPGTVSERFFAGMDYCQELDIGFVFGGGRSTGDNSGVVFNDGFAYLFSNQSFVEVSGLETMEARRRPNVVNVDPHPNRPGNCRFIVWGGITAFSTLSVNDKAWIVEIGPDLIGDATELVFNTAALSGRYGSEAVGFGKNVFVANGINLGQGNGAIYYEDMHRLTLIDDVLNGNTTGNWTQVHTGLQNRFLFSSSMVGAENWVIFGGRGINSDPQYGSFDAARFTMFSFNLTELVDITESVTVVEEVSQPAPSNNGQVLFRIGHLQASLGDNIFVYGGQKIAYGRSTLEQNDFVAVTTIKYGAEDVVLDCDRANEQWCGFDSEFPGSVTEAHGFTRGDTMVAFRGSKFNVLNMTQALESANIVPASKFTSGDEDYDINMKTLQFALVAVCLILMVSLCFLVRTYNDGGEGQFLNYNQAQKSTGVSKEVVRGLPLVKFDPDGHHIPVKMEEDEEGNRTYTEIERVDQDDDENERASTADGTAVTPKQGAYISEEELCPICLLDFEPEEVVMKLPCGHFFHDDCVEPWLLKKGTCPQCRRHVVTGEEVTEKREEEEGQAEQQQQQQQQPEEEEGETNGAATYDDGADNQDIDLETGRDELDEEEDDDEDDDDDDEEDDQVTEMDDTIAAAAVAAEADERRRSRRSSSRRESQRASQRASRRQSRASRRISQAASGLSDSIGSFFANVSNKVSGVLNRAEPAPESDGTSGRRRPSL